MTPPGHRAGQVDVVAEVALQLGFARGFALTCGVRPELVEDFVQDVAVTALERIRDGAFVQPPDKTLRESVRVWLAGIVRNKTFDLGRAIAVRERVMAHGPTAESPMDIDAHAVPSPEARFDAKEELAVLARLKMSPKQREAVAMAAEGYSAREIGERLGVPEETAASYLKRVRKAWERAKGKRGK